jgi:hypothetical protein
MCRFHDTTHSYSDCRVKNKIEEPKDGPSNVFANVGNIFRRPLQGQPQADQDAEIGPETPGYHVVNQRTIVQCSAAVKRPEQSHLHAKDRQCQDLEPLEEEVPLTVGESAHRGECPVCTAIERAETEALNRTIIVGIGFSHVNTI